MLFRFCAVLFSTFILAACLPTQTTTNVETLDEQKKTFVGEITSIEDGIDGSTVELTNPETKEILYAVMSIPNLDPGVEFDFGTVEVGNIIKVTGEPFRMQGKTQMAASSAMSFLPVIVQESKATRAEKIACEKASGKIKKVGKAQWERCVQKLPDAGQFCKNSSECFGRCLLSSSADHAVTGDIVDGVCSDTNHRFGCQPLVSDGKFEGTLCID